MDIKWKKFNSVKERNYIWSGILILTLAGISCAAAGLRYIAYPPQFLLWLGIYLCAAAGLIAFYQLVISLGQDSDGVFIDYFDKWRLETALIILLIFNFLLRIMVFDGWMWRIANNSQITGWSFGFILWTFNMFLLALPFMAVNAALIAISIRHFKRKSLRDNSWLKVIIPKWKEIRTHHKKLYARSYNFQKRQFRQTVFGCILLAFLLFIICMSFEQTGIYSYSSFYSIMLFFIIFACAYGIFLYLSRQKMVGRMGIVLDAVKAIEARQSYNSDTCLENDLYFAEVSKELLSIQKQLNTSAAEQKKSERMKVDLITNVSHDLKTPLTSIISYIDLLQKEEGLSAEANDYLKILAQKSAHLKDMIQDLFEISKATSGTIELDMENLNMRKLVEQTIADMEDQIAASGLRLKKNFSEADNYFSGDGKRLYRVYQNLLENALKYSLEGTRIYIDIKLENQRVTTVIKNIAGYDMDINNGDLTERFTRGDKARSSEGNGLGLSIAKSFTQMCGGELEIDIDGDLFKVTTSFPTTVSSGLSKNEVSLYV